MKPGLSRKPLQKSRGEQRGGTKPREQRMLTVVSARMRMRARRITSIVNAVVQSFISSNILQPVVPAIPRPVQGRAIESNIPSVPVPQSGAVPPLQKHKESNPELRTQAPSGGNEKSGRASQTAQDDGRRKRGRPRCSRYGSQCVVERHERRKEDGEREGDMTWWMHAHTSQ